MSREKAMAYSEQSTGDVALDELLIAHHNAVFDCGDFRHPGEDPLYDEDGQHKTYETAFAAAERTRAELFTALQALITARTELLALAKQYVSECAACSGTGRAPILNATGHPAGDIDCEDCADIRVVIAKAEGRSP